MEAIPTAVHLTTYAGESEDFMHTPLEKLVAQVAAGSLRVQVGKVFRLDDIVAAPEAGRILDESTPSRLAKTVHELLAAPPARIATRRYAEQFDWRSTTEGQITLFREILERPSRHEAGLNAA